MLLRPWGLVIFLIYDDCFGISFLGDHTEIYFFPHSANSYVLFRLYPHLFLDILNCRVSWWMLHHDETSQLTKWKEAKDSTQEKTSQLRKWKEAKDSTQETSQLTKWKEAKDSTEDRSAMVEKD